jgi:hypothetical protein
MIWDQSDTLEEQKQSMRILLQSPDTGEYIRHPERLRWTGALTEACTFPDSFKAAQFCLRHELYHMQIVMRFAADGYEIRLDLALHNRVREAVGLERACA